MENENDEKEKNYEMKKTKKPKKKHPSIQIGDDNNLGVDILDNTNKFYVDKKFEKIERDLEEIKELYSTKQEYESSGFQNDFKRERDLLDKGFKCFCLISLILNTIALGMVLGVICLTGFLWMEIQTDYVMYLALMCSGVIVVVTIFTLLLYYLIKFCFIRRKIGKYNKITLE